MQVFACFPTALDEITTLAVDSLLSVWFMKLKASFEALIKDVFYPGSKRVVVLAGTSMVLLNPSALRVG